MSSKHMTITPAKIIVALIMVAVMVGIVASKGVSASAPPLLEKAPAILVENADSKLLEKSGPKLMGTSALVETMNFEAKLISLSADTVAKGGLQSRLLLVSTDVSSPMPVYTEYSNLPQESIEAKAESVDNGFVYSADIPLSKELQAFTYERCVERNLDYPVILALMWRESRFNPGAVGYNTNGTSDSGIMQINDVHRGWLANDLGVTNLLDPYENITAGTELLGRLVDDHGQHYGLLAYQYGEQGMKNRVANGYTSSELTELLYGKSTEFQGLLNQAA